MDLKFIETSNRKVPLKSWKEESNLVDDYSSLTNAALIIPEGIVIVDFDGDNVAPNGEIYDSKIGHYIISKYPNIYWTVSRNNHFHLFFKVPKNLKLKKLSDVKTVGGITVDYLTAGNLEQIKDYGNVRKSKCDLSIDVLESVPELPIMLYPLYGFENNSLIGLHEGDGRDSTLFRHIIQVRRQYKNLNMSEAIKFINHFLFKDPLKENIVDSMIERSGYYATSKIKIPDEYEYKEPKLIRLSDIEEKDAKWIWYPYVPLGTVMILAGDAGLGKSYFSLYIASILSTGREFPNTDNSLNEFKSPVNVIVQNGEDALDYTIRKRINTLKGNADNIYIIDESNETFHLDQITYLKNLIIDYNVKLVIIDPIQQYLPNGINMDKATDVRSSLAPLKEIAEKEKCTFLLIMHRNKNNKVSNDLHRVLGSVDFSALCRGILTICKENECRVLKHTKSSFGPLGSDIQFDITNNGIIFLDDNERKDEKGDMFNEWIKIIENELSDGKVVESTKMLNLAKKNGIPDRTLIKIKKELHIKDLQKDKHHHWYIDHK